MGTRLRTIAKHAWNHELGAVADSVDSAILDDNPFVADHEALQWADDPSEVRL